MLGPEIITNTLSKVRPFGPQNRLWQYHPRSDHHSKVCAVAVVIDLLQESPVLRDHVERGEVGFGVNPVLTDPSNGRRKTLDLAIARPNDAKPIRGARTLRRLAEDLDMVLAPAEWRLLDELPQIRECHVKEPLIALENKACMTAFSKAAPRLRNELDGSREAINNCGRDVIAGGLVLVNAAKTFVSPTFRLNGEQDDPALREITHHVQPEDAAGSVRKLRGIQPRRNPTEDGFDALGIVVVEAPNDGSPWRLLTDPAYGAPAPDEIWHYRFVVQRLAGEYRKRFGR
jgi:hypothetical protein